MSARSSRRDYRGKLQARQARRRNSTVSARLTRGSEAKSRRSVGPRSLALPFSPPEDWHEPSDRTGDYRVVVQQPGQGYCHVVTPAEVRDRLAELPETFLYDLDVVQLSRMTRKKQSLPCYGMQWGPALYLYPIDESLTEHFGSAPPPAVFNEARMYGGRWQQAEGGTW